MARKEMKMLSANLRGFATNLGDFTHSFINKNTPDIIIAVETFLNQDFPANFGKLPGYSNWTRRDRQGRQGGGVHGSLL